MAVGKQCGMGGPSGSGRSPCARFVITSSRSQPSSGVHACRVHSLRSKGSCGPLRPPHTHGRSLRGWGSCGAWGARSARAATGSMHPPSASTCLGCLVTWLPRGLYPLFLPAPQSAQFSALDPFQAMEADFGWVTHSVCVGWEWVGHATFGTRPPICTREGPTLPVFENECVQKERRPKTRGREEFEARASEAEITKVAVIPAHSASRIHKNFVIATYLRVRRDPSRLPSLSRLPSPTCSQLPSPTFSRLPSPTFS